MCPGMDFDIVAGWSLSWGVGALWRGVGVLSVR